MEYTNTPDNELEVNQSAPAYDRNRLYTVEERDAFDDGVRTELHDGLLIVMDSPVVKHQSILGEISGQLWLFLKRKTCKVFSAPFDVRLNMKEDTVFQPDIIVVCDESKYENGKKCLGAPDLVIEILSPSTSRTDKVYKFNKYQKAGVREYWIVDPEQDIVQVNVLHDGSYITYMYNDTDTISVTVLDGCTISLPDVFSE